MTTATSSIVSQIIVLLMLLCILHLHLYKHGLSRLHPREFKCVLSQPFMLYLSNIVISVIV